MRDSERSPTYVLAETDQAPLARSYWVVEGLFLAGCYPGTPDREMHERMSRTLADAGIRCVINLMQIGEQDAQGRPFERYQEPFQGHCRAAGDEARCIRMPIEDLGVPSREEMVAILDTIDASLADGRPVYLHCWGGIGRTGTVVGCWLLRHGLATPDDVLDRIRRLRSTDAARQRASPETPRQRRFVQEWREEPRPG